MVSECTNIFHTLYTKIGIKDSEWCLVLKYHSGLHMCIQKNMEFLDISSLGAAYRYVVKIEKKFKQKNKWDFSSAKPSQKNHGKGGPKFQGKGQIKHGQPQDNQSRPPTKKGNRKLKKDIGKWCEFHKIPWHNTDECCSKQSLLAKTKASGSDVDSEYDSKLEKGKWIIDTEPNATILPQNSS
jgi:hypothetical protein